MSHSMARANLKKSKEFSTSTTGQLNSEWINKVIVSPKMPTKDLQISALPSNKLPGQKSGKILVGILGETMTS